MIRSTMFPYANDFKNVDIIVDNFRTIKNCVKQISTDETLNQIDGQNY